MKSKKMLSLALAAMLTMQSGALVFAGDIDNNDYIAKELARISAKYNTHLSPVEGFDYNSLTLDAIKHSIETLEIGLQSNQNKQNKENKIIEVTVPSVEDNTAYIQRRLDELNAKYNTKISMVKEFDYNTLTREQINDSIDFLEKNLLLNQNKNHINKVNLSVPADSNGNVSLPEVTIWSECPEALIKLTGAVDYTSEHDKALGDIFKSIDSVKTWIVANWEFLISHDWDQKNVRINIYNRGKRAEVDVTGVLRATILIKGMTFHIDKELSYSYDLSFPCNSNQK
jgi:hypothetical protein